MFCVSLFVGVFIECFFFFKQKTAYEMRISDWSSDVCSSDLNATPLGIRHARDAATGLASLRRYFTEQFDAGRIRESDSALGRLMNHSENGALTEIGRASCRERVCQYV